MKVTITSLPSSRLIFLNWSFFELQIPALACLKICERFRWLCYVDSEKSLYLLLLTFVFIIFKFLIDTIYCIKFHACKMKTKISLHIFKYEFLCVIDILRFDLKESFWYFIFFKKTRLPASRSSSIGPEGRFSFFHPKVKVKKQYP